LGCAADFSASSGAAASPRELPVRNLFTLSGVRWSRLIGCKTPASQGTKTKMNKIRIRTAVLPVGLPARFWLAMAAIALALLALPHAGHAQGIVRGAREGSYEGNRVAGPVGGVVGGAVGAGVGGAMGAVRGVFGIPDRGYRRGYRCRGYYNRYGHFRCYR
jgi:hypothetical protein